ncbi:MAG: methyltransferase domain-containing protein [Deltaproteobacteria bacterium]|nr:methyltransferase domain-containing protein [Deltaproteobacteria bacterium]MBW2306232.1 methyltransferase domain-containing protein [Deltaproteobacteria bacterium]
MRFSLLPYLMCPSCSGDLSLAQKDVEESGHLMEGMLLCRVCGHGYPIRRGVPLLLDREEEPLQRQVSETFGFEWDRFPSHRDFMASSALLRDFLQLECGATSPMADGVVVEGGCGSGRWLPRVHEDLGAATVIGMDISSSVHHAFRLTRENPFIHVIQADIRKPPLRPSADVVYSLGVIDHLENPLEGFRGLLRCLRPGGLIFLWIYAWEGNLTYLRLIGPLRRWTTRMNRRCLYGLSRVMGVFLYGIIHSIYRVSLPLPYRSYFSVLRKLRVEDLGLVIFDQLAPPVAHYLRKEEVERLFREAGATLSAVFHRNQNSWTAHGFLP